MIAAVACFAQGETVIRDAAELKVKESNRIDAMVRNLAAMGADVTETEDGMIIRGGRPPPRRRHRQPGRPPHRHDFRRDRPGRPGGDGHPRLDCVRISYPEFERDLARDHRIGQRAAGSAAGNCRGIGLRGAAEMIEHFIDNQGPE